MANRISESVQLTSGAPIKEIVFREPFPWASLCVLGLWFTVVVLGIVGIVKRWKGRSTKSLSEKTLVVAIVVLFLGSGIIVWQLGLALGCVMSLSSATSKIMIQFALLDVSGSLFFAALNLVFAGAGFIAAILLRDTPCRNPAKRP